MRLTRLAETTFLADAEPAAATALRTVLTRYRLASKVDDRGLRRALRHDRGGRPEGRDAGARRARRAAARRGAGGRGHRGGARGRAGARTGVDVLRREGVRADRASGRCSTTRGRGSPRRCRTTTGASSATRRTTCCGSRPACPRFGAEIDEQVMPAEVGVVDRAVSFTKGCYVGQEPVARLHYRGHANRGLRSILLDGASPEAGAAVTVEGRDVGRVTSAVESPTLGRGGRAGDRAARGRPGPARRRRHRRRRARGRARGGARVPLAPLTC